MRKILTVEDDKDIQILLTTFLVSEGYHMTIANDGVEAITEFTKLESILLIGL